jgi:alkylresorcinol/alkylpyrone synthase
MTSRAVPVAIHKVHSAFPTHRVSQTRCRNEMVKFIDSRPANLTKQKAKLIDWYTKVSDNSGIDEKNMHFRPELIHNRSLNHSMVMKEAFDTGIKMVLDLKEKSLQDAEIEEKELAAVFIGTEVTNSLTLDTYTHFGEDCNPFLESDPMHGQGCIGGAKNLARAYQYLQSHPEKAVQIVSLDLYSRLWTYAFNNIIDEMLPNIDNPETLSLLRSSLMMGVIIGDAATVTTLVGREHRHYKKWVRGGYPYIYGSVQAILSGTTNTVNVLDRPYGPVPLLREEISSDGSKVLGMAIRETERKYNTPKEMDLYCNHPGGVRVLQTIEKEHGISKEKLSHSYKVLRNHGNCAAPTVMLVLKSIMETPISKLLGSENILVGAIGPGMKSLSLPLKRRNPRSTQLSTC